MTTHHESSAFGVGLRYKKRCPLQTRAAKLPKETPAVRDLLTAGVVGVTGLEPMASWSRTKQHMSIYPALQGRSQEVLTCI